MMPTNGARDVLGVALGYMAAQAVYVAARLRLADRLADGPAGADVLAARCECEPATMTFLLRGLVSCGVLNGYGDGTYELTPAGHALRADAPESVLRSVLLYGSLPLWQAWGHLEDSVRSGRPAFTEVHGMGVFEYCAADPAVGQMFQAAMAEDTVAVAHGVARAYDFGSLSTVVDVGAGNATLLAVLLRIHPRLRGIALDSAHALAGAPAVLAEAGVIGRCELVEADFFGELPRADAYLLKSVLHDWPDDVAVRLLTNCREVMSRGGAVLVVERVLPETARPGYDPHMVRNLLNMPFMLGGSERGFAEFDRILAAAGLRFISATPLPGSVDHHLIAAACAR